MNHKINLKLNEVEQAEAKAELIVSQSQTLKDEISQSGQVVYQTGNGVFQKPETLNLLDIIGDFWDVKFDQILADLYQGRESLLTRHQCVNKLIKVLDDCVSEAAYQAAKEMHGE